MSVTGAKFGGYLDQGFIRPGKFEAMLEKIKDAGHASEQAMHGAKYAVMGAEAATAAVRAAISKKIKFPSNPLSPHVVPYHRKPESVTVQYGYLAPPLPEPGDKERNEIKEALDEPDEAPPGNTGTNADANAAASTDSSANGKCEDVSEGCESYKRLGRCSTSEWVKKNCRKTCKICTEDWKGVTKEQAMPDLRLLLALDGSSRFFRPPRRRRRTSEFREFLTEAMTSLVPGVASACRLPLVP